MKIKKYDSVNGWVQQYPEVNVGAIVTSNDIDSLTGSTDEYFLRADGSWAKVETSGNQFVNISGDTMTGNLTTTSGNNNGIYIGSGGANITSVTPSSKDVVIQDVAQIRFGSASWDWNSWAGLAFNASTEVLTIGGPASSVFSSNTNPPSIDVNFDGLNSSGLKVNNNTVWHAGNDDNLTKKYTWQPGIVYWHNGGTDAGFRNILKVTSSSLSTGGILYVDGTSGSVVVNARFEILVNHYQDIVVKSLSGGYTQVKIKVQTGNNEDFNILIARNRNDTNTTTINATFIPYDQNATVTTYTNNPAVSYSSVVLTHTTIAFSENISATGGSTGKLFVEGSQVWHAGNDGSGSGLDADTLDTYHASAFVRSDTSDTMSGDYRIESGSFASLILDRGTTGSGSIVQFENNNGIIGGIGAFGDDGLQFRTTDGTQMVIDSNNRVGIGTTSPSAGFKLQVEGDIKLNSTLPKIQLTDTNNDSDFHIANNNGVFEIADTSNQEERFAILSNGKVGIGTSSPTGKLEIVGDSGLYIKTTTNNPTDGAQIRFSDSSSSSYAQYGWIKYKHADTTVETEPTNSSDGFIIGGSEANTIVSIQGHLNVESQTNFENQVEIDSGDLLVRNGDLDVNGQAKIGSGLANARSYYGLTAGFTSNATFSSNADVQDSNRTLSLVNESTTTNTYSTLSFRNSPSSGTSMADFKYVHRGTNSGDLIYTNNNGGTWSDQFSILSNGNVGIGTTSPASPLHTYKNTSSGSNIISLETLNNKWDFRIGNSGEFLLRDGSYDRLTINNSNGNATFANDLTVQGDLYVNGSFTTIDTDTTTTEQWSVTNDGTGPAVIINQKGSQPVIDIQDDGTSVFHIEDGGNVGIGTTNPATDLHIKGTTASVRVDRDATSYGGTYQWAEGGTLLWEMKADHDGGNNNSLQIATASAPTVTFEQNGRVGIGTSNPAYKLDVVGAGQFLSDSSTQRVLYLKQNTAGTGNIIQFQGASAENVWEVVGRDSNFYIYNNDLSKRAIYIEDSTNYIGLNNNTTPSYELDVYGQIRSYVSSTTTHSKIWSENGSTGQASLELKNSEGHFRTITSGGAYYVYDQTDGAHRLYIDTSGDVGIGTTTPSEKLDVNGTFKAGGFTATDTDEWPNFYWLRGTAGWDEGLIKGSSSRGVFGKAHFGIHFDDDRSFAFHTSGWDTEMEINGDGKIYMKGPVGIGTSSPGSALDVAGDIQANRLYDRNNTSYYVDPASHSVLNTVNVQRLEVEGAIFDVETDSLRMPMVKGGHYNNDNSTVTGAIYITMPSGTYANATMLNFFVDVYDYSGGSDGESFTLHIGGYIYTDGTWHNTFSNLVSGRTDRFFTVRFNYDSTNSYNIIYIGETTSTWSYPKVTVRDFSAGYAGADDADWYNNSFSVGISSSFLGSTYRSKNAENVASNSLQLGGVNASNYLRSDTADTASGNITFTGDIIADADILVNSPVNDSAPISVKSLSNNRAIHIEETGTGSESWQLGVDTDGNLNFFNSGSSSYAVRFNDNNTATFSSTVTASNGKLSSVEYNGSDVNKVNFSLSGSTLTITTS